MIYGIIGAMESEVKLLIEALSADICGKYAMTDVYKANINDNTVYITQCSIGKVNAACQTQMLIDRFNVEAVINTGVAGCIDRALKTGDIVICDKVTYHDFYPIDILKTNRPYTFEFFADKQLKEKALNAKIQAKLASGNIATGDCFVESEEKANYIKETFDACCVEMEGAAVAHVCLLNNVPFLIIRAISDFADENADMSFEQFKDFASDQAAKIVLHILKN